MERQFDSNMELSVLLRHLMAHNKVKNVTNYVSDLYLVKKLQLKILVVKRHASLFVIVDKLNEFDL